MSLLLIAAGGALGAVSRYLLAGLVHRFASPWFPWGTLVVNVAGCLAFGVVMGAFEARGALGPGARLFLLVGLLGGFTTFSTFAYESVELLRDGQAGPALANAAGHVVLGFGALWIGLALARALWVRP